MRFSFKFLFVLTLLSAPIVGYGDDGAIIVPVVIAQSTDETIEETRAEEQPKSWVKDKVEPQTKKIERFVMPITSWVEEQLHDSSIANPLIQQTRPKQRNNTQISLREAIELARQQHQGAVLSADKIISSGNVTYRIKILSEDGVMRIVTVAGARFENTMQEQP